MCSQDARTFSDCCEIAFEMGPLRKLMGGPKDGKMGVNKK
jgi:hypothetical protein